MTTLIEQCLECGSVGALFPVLKGWSIPDLRELLVDLGEFQSGQIAALGKAFECQRIRGEASLTQIDRLQDEAAADVAMKCAEIASVALYYLRDESEEEK